MKFLSFESGGSAGLAVSTEDGLAGLLSTDPLYPGDLVTLIAQGGDALTDAARVLARGQRLNMERVNVRPPLSNPPKIVCVGLNYGDHSKESGFETPDFPTLFGRFNSSLVGHGGPIIRPSLSEQLDYEGELAAIIGKTTRQASKAEALDHVAGYSIFNDASIRDYQFKSPQWTPGKNFDDTGAFGPWFVTADALPPGCKGLRLQTRLNGEVVQDAMIDDMVFSVASLVSILSSFMTLEPGDVIVTGTPSGVGLARNPQLFMKDGDICEVEIEGIGVLSNPVRDRLAQPATRVA